MGLQSHLNVLERIVEGLRSGSDVTVIERGSERILRISWLNILNNPNYFQALAEVIASEIKLRGYRPDAIASIETSGAKYGVAVSIETGLPYFSIHKSSKIIFTEPMSTDSHSVTESRGVSLYVDRSIASNFQRVVLVDDIRRSSRTINSAVELLGRCGVAAEACFVILDLAFAGFGKPSAIPEDRYHPLLVISSVDGYGRCVVSEGVALKYLGGHV